MKKTKKIFIAVIIAIIAILPFALSLYFYVRSIETQGTAFVLEDTLPQGNGQKARVVLLAGQSNAAGCSWNEYLEKNVSAEKYAEYANGYDNVYINYYSSGNNVSGGFVKAAVGQGETPNHFGPELGLAEKLHQACPDETVFIIKCAWSGTNLYSQWLSPSSEGETGNLYADFVKYVKQNMEYLLSKGYDVKVEAMCWMQGESDSFFTSTALGYESNLTNFIADLRSEFSAYASHDGIAFADAYIAANPNVWVYYDLVNSSKKAVADASTMNVVIDTNAKGLTCANEPAGSPDLAHYDALSQINLGYLFAAQVVRFFD